MASGKFGLPSQVSVDNKPQEDYLIVIKKRISLIVQAQVSTIPSPGFTASGIDMGLTHSISDMSLKEPVDSSCGSFTSLSSLSAEICDEELQQYFNMMPQDIKFGFIDCLILYAEKDRKGAEKFRLHLINEIQIVSNGPVIARLYDCADLISLAGGQISRLEESVKRSTFILLYLTKNFIKDKWMQFSSEACIIESIHNEKKKWCVVPVYAQKKSTLSVPFSLQHLRGLDYYSNDEHYRRCVARLIGDQVSVRVQGNKELKKQQRKWVEDYKRGHPQINSEQQKTLGATAKDKKTREDHPNKWCTVQ